MFRKHLSFFHLFGFHPTVEPIDEPANAEPIVASAKPVTPPSLEPGPYALVTPKGVILVDGISLAECMRIAPDIAKSKHTTVKLTIPVSRRPKPVRA